MLLRDAARWLEFNETRIREDNIDLAFLGDNRLIKIVDVLEFRHVSFHRGYVRANLRHSLIQFRLTPAHDEDVRPFFYKTLCGGQADATASSSNNCYFALKLCHALRSFNAKVNPSRLLFSSTSG